MFRGYRTDQTDSVSPVIVRRHWIILAGPLLISAVSLCLWFLVLGWLWYEVERHPFNDGWAGGTTFLLVFILVGLLSTLLFAGYAVIKSRTVEIVVSRRTIIVYRLEGLMLRQDRFPLGDFIVTSRRTLGDYLLNTGTLLLTNETGEYRFTLLTPFEMARLILRV